MFLIFACLKSILHLFVFLICLSVFNLKSYSIKFIQFANGLPSSDFVKMGVFSDVFIAILFFCVCVSDRQIVYRFQLQIQY